LKSGWTNCITSSPEETFEKGKQFARFIETGDIFALSGQLASGKTTFIKGIANGLGYKGEVTSPTFTLINEYHSIPEIIHLDCYRETNLNRWINLGINEYFNTDSIVFIEWPEVIKALLPDRTITILLSHIEENKRKININI